MATQIPAGWYTDPYANDRRRWWDGKQWTRHVKSDSPTPPPPQLPPPPKQSIFDPAKTGSYAAGSFGIASNSTPQVGYTNVASAVLQPPERPWWQRKRIFIPAGILVLFGFAAALADPEEQEDFDIQALGKADPTEPGDSTSIPTESLSTTTQRLVVTKEDFGIDALEIETRASDLLGIEQWQPTPSTAEGSSKVIWSAESEDGARYAYSLAGNTKEASVTAVAVFFKVDVSEYPLSISFTGGPPVFAAGLAAPETRLVDDWINAVGEVLLPNMDFDGPNPQEFEVDRLVSVTGQIRPEQSGLLLVLRPHGAPLVDLSIFKPITSNEPVPQEPPRSTADLPAADSPPSTTTTTEVSSTSPPTTTTTTPPTTPAPTPKPTSEGCDPNYSGCVPIASDVDCAGGSGNGPAYVRGPIRVLGSDIYDLDSNNDGIACE